jgi:GNAT superfamily N-acetyltransferase
MDVAFAPAATLSLESLADLFTRSFAEYFYPGVTTPELLAKRVRVENIDLLRSPVLLVDGAPAGVALLARRDERAWCGGFGVVLAQRGRGLANALADEMLAQARASGARRLILEVLTRNDRALRVYQRAGLTITRRLLVLSWRPDPDGPPLPPAPPYPMSDVDPERLVLGHFAALHPARPAWQRDAASLLAQSDTRGLALPGGDTIHAYAIVSGDVSGLRIGDFAARDDGWANHLLGALKAQARTLLSINEPAESPLTPAFTRAGFVTADEQHEMEIIL